jgi:hypothetical protein
MRNKLILILTLFLLLYICLPVYAAPSASEGTVDISGGIGNATTNQTIAEKVIGIYKNTAYVVGSFAALCLLGVGFMFIKSRGDEKKLSEAKTWLSNIVVGIIIAASALIIVGFIIWLVTN